MEHGALHFSLMMLLSESSAIVLKMLWHSTYNIPAITNLTTTCLESQTQVNDNAKPIRAPLGARAYP
jgi:hypothetical protein